MRARCFHYWTSRLALAAALLLVLAPGVTRVLAATSPHAGVDHAAAPMTATAANATHQTPMPAHPDQAAHPDCAYCPLLGGLDQVAPQAPLLAASSTATRFTAIGKISPCIWRHPNGLGSRGPPTALQPHHPA